MATKLQVSCINKRNHKTPHQRIRNIGGIVDDGRWKVTEPQAIAAIEAGTHQFYVRNAGRAVRVIVATRKGRKYLKTSADGYAPNNLLNLPGR